MRRCPGRLLGLSAKLYLIGVTAQESCEKQCIYTWDALNLKKLEIDSTVTALSQNAENANTVANKTQ